MFCFKQKTAYDVRISDWSSDVCSSDLPHPRTPNRAGSGGRTVAARFGVCRKDLVRAMAKVSPGEFVNQVKAEASKIVWPTGRETKIGRASCRERVCQYV